MLLMNYILLYFFRVGIPKKKERTNFLTVNGSSSKYKQDSNRLWGLIYYQLLVKNMTTGDSKHPLMEKKDSFNVTQLQQHSSLRTENKSSLTSHTNLHLNHELTKDLFMWDFFPCKKTKSDLICFFYELLCNCCDSLQKRKTNLTSLRKYLLFKLSVCFSGCIFFVLNGLVDIFRCVVGIFCHF